MKTSPQGIEFIAEWERFAPKPYRDAAGILTWGFGHAIKPGEAAPAKISRDDALSLLAQDVAEAEAAVKRGIRVPLEQHQFDALVSLAFNAGASAVNPTISTLARKLNGGDYGGASTEFSRWSKATIGGVKKTLSGLLKRRLAEAAMFRLGIYDASH